MCLNGRWFAAEPEIWWRRPRHQPARRPSSVAGTKLGDCPPETRGGGPTLVGPREEAFQPLERLVKFLADGPSCWLSTPPCHSRLADRPLSTPTRGVSGLVRGCDHVLGRPVPSPPMPEPMKHLDQISWYWILLQAIRVGAAVATTLDPTLVGAHDLTVVDATLDTYRTYADRALAGQMPYRDYLVEYPLAAFPLFLAPRLLAASPVGFQVFFSIEMLLCDAMAASLVARRVERTAGRAAIPGRLAWYTLFFVSLCPLPLGRYDLAPMTVAFAAACWWFTGQRVLGGAAAGLGTMMKIFPGLVAGPALLWEMTHPRTSRGRGLIAFVVAGDLIAMLWFALGGDGVLESVRFHMTRGLEIESTYAGLVSWLLPIMGTKVTSDFNHGAFHITKPVARWLVPLALPVQAAVLLVVLGRYWRSGMGDGVRFAGAAILAFIVAGKVLSPQFLIWPIPFLAVLGGRTGVWARRLYAPCCLATTVIYPGAGFYAIMAGEPWAIALLNARNALLWGVLACLLFGPAAAQSGSAQGSTTDGS